MSVDAAAAAALRQFDGVGMGAETTSDSLGRGARHSRSWSSFSGWRWSSITGGLVVLLLIGFVACVIPNGRIQDAVLSVLAHRAQQPFLEPSEHPPKQQLASLDELHDWRPKENASGAGFRNYEDSIRQDIVQQTYHTMHSKQTVEFGERVREQWLKFDKGEFTVMEMIALLDNLVDDSDPDNDLPNSIHDFQTAERIRQQWPELDWFHLVGLLHDVGKVLALKEVAGEDVLEQWAVVGDTFPVGCAPAEECVFGRKSFEGNPDLRHATYSTERGMYEPGCGISKLMMSWGHDEYMYWVLRENGCTIPEQGLNMIRFHSFYPWHDKGAYMLFEAPEDAEMKRWVKEFNKFDLYSKGDDIPDVAALKPYYQSLLDKYGIGGKLRW